MVQALRTPPIGFAHRGGRAAAPENTLEAFLLAVEHGATGLETDAFVTADGVAVLDHDGVVRRGLRKVPMAALARAELPAHVPSLAELYEAVGTGLEVCIDLKDPAAAPAVVEAARAAGGDDALGRLWLCHPDWRTVASWRALSPVVKLVDSTRLKHLKDGPERRAAELVAAGVDAINMHHTDWTGGLTTLFHRFELTCFAWDCQHERTLANMLAAGIDGLHSDDVPLLRAAIDAWTR